MLTNLLLNWSYEDDEANVNALVCFQDAFWRGIGSVPDISAKYVSYGRSVLENRLTLLPSDCSKAKYGW